MADTITEFYNADVPLTDFADDAKVTLITTTATETAVVKDITLIPSSNLTDQAVTLDVNDTDIASLTDNATGTELIGVSSTLKAGIPNLEYTDFGLGIFTGNNGDYRSINDEYLGEFSEDSYVETLIAGTQAISTVYEAYLDDSGTYLTIGTWDLNSSTSIKKYLVSTGATLVTGTATNYSCKPTLSDDNYAYWAYSNTVRRMKMDDTSGDVANWSTALSGYPSSTYPMFGSNTQVSPNGERCYIMKPAESSTAYARIVDQDTGANIISSINLGGGNSGFFSGSGAGPNVQPFYSVARAKWMILLCCANTTVRIAELPLGGGSPTILASASIDEGTATTNQMSIIDDKIFHYNSTDGIVTEYDFDLNVVGQVFGPDARFAGYDQYARIQSKTPTSGEIAGRDYSGLGSYRVRVTGIKTTEVS